MAMNPRRRNLIRIDSSRPRGICSASLNIPREGFDTPSSPVRGGRAMTAFVRTLAFLLGFALLAGSPVYAQASLVGVVKDTSGALLPGVTVEASSPALIEK